MATEFISNSWLMPTNANAEANRVSNYSLSFDGVDESILLSSSVSFANEFSLSIWIKPDGFSNDQVILGYGSSSSNWIRLSSASQITFRIASTSLNFNDVGNNLVDGVWQHLLFYRDASNNVGIYRNGTAFSSTQTNTNTLELLTIGKRGTKEYTGNITQVSFFDYELSASQVTDLYGTGSAIGNPMSLTTKPVAYYPLGDSAFNGEFLATNNATELYENYSFLFDGTDDFISTNLNVDNYTNLTYSVWVNPTSLNQRGGLASLSSVNNFVTAFWDGSGGKFYVYIGNVLSQITGIWSGSKFGTLGQEKWLHIAVVYDGSGATDADRLKVYADGDYVAFNSLGSIPTSIPSGGGDLIIGKWGTSEYDGKMSNVSIYSSSLTSAQVTTLYNSGKPFDLNTFAVTPVSWFRLGASGSSFDGTNWTVLDEIGTNNGTSANMTQADLVDGVGATGNGVSSGMSSGTNKTGDAPYSTSNSVSYNMSVTAKSTSVPT
tara:strand:+ start:1380 stop:2852 length:1473 start_codon:yes stop_codon:yes gene_type:complete